MGELASSGLTSPFRKTPDDWSLAQLKDVTTKIGSGATPRGGQKVYLSKRENFALVRSQNVFDRYFSDEGLAFISDEHAAELESVWLQPDDVLLNITGDGITFARSCLVPERILPACVNQHVSIIRVDQQVCDPGYIASYLTHPVIKHYIESFNAGGSRRAVTKGNIESFVVPLPPLEEQRAIAYVLGSLDDKIELNRRMNATLEAMARAIFKSWFVDFDPVHAKASGEQPFGMDAATAALFPDAFEESELGVIPKGWKIGTVGDEFDITMGQSPPGSTYNEEGNGLPFYQGRRDFGFRYPTLRVYCIDPKRLAEKDDILVSVRAPVGDINMAIEKCCIGRGVAAIRHRSGSRSYTYYAMHSLRARFDKFEAEGTVFGSISGENFRGMEFLVPPIDVVDCFENLVYPIDQLIEMNETHTLTLIELRDALLPRLISGELRVGDFDNAITG